MTRSIVRAIPGLRVGAIALSILGVSAAPALAQGAPEPDIRDAESLLRSLERSDENLAAITADVQYDRRFRLQGDQHIRRGSLYFRVDDADAVPPRRSFAIVFNTLIVGSRLEEDPESWLFDGEWLVEKRPPQKQFIKRRIAPPDANFDPLRIGEGPMPIPIGQRANDIMARYDVELRPEQELFGEGETGIAQFVRGTKHILLRPRPEFADQEDLQEIRLWCRWDAQSGRFLPRLTRTLNRAGDESFVQLVNVRVQEIGGAPLQMPAGVFNLDPPPPGEGWAVEIIDDLPGSTADSQAGARE